MTTQTATQTLISGGRQAHFTNSFTASDGRRVDTLATSPQIGPERQDAGTSELISISEEDFYPWFRANGQRLLRLLRALQDDPAALKMLRTFLLESEDQVRCLLDEVAAHPALQQELLDVAEAHRPEEEYQIQAEIVVNRTPIQPNGSVPTVTPVAAGSVAVH